MSWAWTLLGDLSPLGDAAMAARDGRRVAGREQRPEDRLHDRPAEVALEIGRARRHAGARRPAPTPSANATRASPRSRHRSRRRRSRAPTFQYGLPSFQSRSIVSEPEQHEDVPEEQREPRAASLDQLGGPRRDDDHGHRGGHDRGARRRASSTPSTFCRYCWPMNIAPISDPNTMIPAHAATQNTRRDGDREVVQRVRRPPLAHDERDARRRPRSRPGPSASARLVGHGREVDRRG